MKSEPTVDCDTQGIMAPTAHRVPIIEKFAFGLRGFSQQVGNNGMTLLAFPAYGIILGLDPSLIGLVFAIMRIYDGIIDPVMGWISDNTRTRWGRRRPYIFGGAILGGLTFALLWMARPEWSDAAKTAYFIVFSFLFYTCFTVLVVPGDALGWELTPDYSERTRVMTWFSVTVKLTLLVLPWMFLITQAPFWSSESQGLRAVGILFGILFIVTGVMAAIFCKERNFQIAAKDGHQGLLSSLKLSLKNRTYLLVCGITLASIFGGTVYMLFGTHLAVYYLFDGSKAEGGKFFGILGTVAALTGLITIVAINRFFAKADKRNVLLFSIACAIAGWISAILLITPTQPWLTLVPVVLNAVATAGFWLLIGSILADVADADELANGFRREGALASFVSFLCKAAGTLGAVIGGVILSRAGFNADLASQPPAVLSWMKVIYIGFPLVGYSVAFLLALRYPLSRHRMLEIRAELEQRRGAVFYG